jgi:lipoprotein-anchoring transpeptidase ErfK/SrfK
MLRLLMLVILSSVVSACTYSTSTLDNNSRAQNANYIAPNYASRLPEHLDVGNEKTVLVDPNVHAWGAYDSSGSLIRAGQASAGSNWCPDLGRPCHTHAGTYHINSLGSPGCKSSEFPMPHGGAPMPYCMFFNRNQALHGAPEGEVVDGNISHGCVRMHVPDAEWLRYNFANVGTKVIVLPY